MTYEILIRRIDERLKATGLSERKACLNAGVGVNSIRHIRKRDHAPKLPTLAALAAALGVASSYFTDAASDSGDAHAIALASVHIIGAVQAGVWKEAIEWPAEDWFRVEIPADSRYPEIERFGLEVRGNSMNRLYPEGTIVIIARFGDLARAPNPGERVVVLTRSTSSGDYEATLKEFQVEEDGRRVLWPRSTDPDFQRPIILPDGDLPIASNGELIPRTVSAGNFEHAAGEPDIIISGLVIGSYRRE